MHGGKRTWLLVLMAAMGCTDDVAPVAPPPPQVDDIGSNFDQKRIGTIQGRVVWRDVKPDVPAFQVHAYLDYVNAKRLRGRQPNPHAPVIDPATGGVGRVAIILRGVQPARARTWNHPPVQIETTADGLSVIQGSERGRIGFVRRGSEVEFLSRDQGYHMVSARGAAFFTLPFASADQPTRRRLNEPGHVEISEGAGFFWRRAHLLVLDHPYATLTAGDGAFQLDQVPAGTYELTAWLLNWHVDKQDRNPETGIISRIYFAPAVELVQTVAVNEGQAAQANLQVSADQFKSMRSAAK